MFNGLFLHSSKDLTRTSCTCCSPAQPGSALPPYAASFQYGGQHQLLYRAAACPKASAASLQSQKARLSHYSRATVPFPRSTHSTAELRSSHQHLTSKPFLMHPNTAAALLKETFMARPAQQAVCFSCQSSGACGVRNQQPPCRNQAPKCQSSSCCGRSGEGLTTVPSLSNRVSCT